MKSTLKKAALPAVLLALAIARLALGDPMGSREPPAHPPRPEAPPPPETSVLGDLAVGDDVRGFVVERITEENGVVTVELRQGERGMRVWVRPTDPAQPAAQRRSGYDLTYGNPRPDLQPATDREFDAIVRKLGDYVDRAAR